MSRGDSTPANTSGANGPTEESVARRIRALRKARGLSLSEVEQLSGGKISAVALGSYERCDRALSLARLLQLSHFFEVPLSHFISDSDKGVKSATLVIDLRRAKALARDPLFTNDPRLTALLTLVGSIAQRRSDWNAEVMSLRESDLSTLSLMAGESENEVLLWLAKNEALLTGLSQI